MKQLYNKEIVSVHPEKCEKIGVLVDKNPINRQEIQVTFRRTKLLSDEFVRILPDNFPDSKIYEFKVRRAIKNEPETVTLPVENFSNFDTIAVFFQHPETRDLVDPEIMHHLKTPGFNKQLELNTILKDAGDYYDMEHKKIISTLEHYKALKKKWEARREVDKQVYEDTKDEIDSLQSQARDIVSKADLFRASYLELKKNEIDGTRVIAESAEMLKAFHDSLDAVIQRTHVIKQQLEGTYEEEFLKKEISEINNKMQSSESKMNEISARMDKVIQESKKEIQETKDKLRQKKPKEKEVENEISPAELIESEAGGNDEEINPE